MKFSVQREHLLGPLQAVIGVVQRRQTMPILANLLVSASGNRLQITATDLEVELYAEVEVDLQEEGEATIPGRKLVDICRALPEGSAINVQVKNERARINAGKSRFSLATLPAAEFPAIEDINAGQSVTLTQADARRLLEKTHFAMAHEDVRHYLNGLLFEIHPERIRAVATDGHRLALCDVIHASKGISQQQVIVPRKGVLELQRLLGTDGNAEISLGTNHIRVDLGDIRCTSKLVEGRFPDYEHPRVMPQVEQSHPLRIDVDELRQGLQRTAILSNQKYRGIRLELRSESLLIQAHNPEQEEAEEELSVQFEGPEMEIGFNVNYLLDALGAIDGDQVEIRLQDPNNSCLVREPGREDCRYVVMPMRL